MAKVPAGAPIPSLSIRGTHVEVGTAIGRAMRREIQAAVENAQAALWRDEKLDAAGLHERMAPCIEAAERWTPELVAELRARATAADVPFDLLSYLSAGGLPPPPVGRHGCTSLALRTASGRVVLGHTEDALLPAPEELFLLRAAVAGPDGTVPPGSRFTALCYVHTLPGCSAGVNDQGLGLLMDWLPDPDARAGLTFDYLTRALLVQPSIDAALDFLARTPRGGSGNCLLAQGDRVVNLELTSTRMAQVEPERTGLYVHTNHFLDPVLARAAGEPQADSLPRLARGRALAHPQMDVARMKQLLADRGGFPDSICRERTLGAFVAELPTLHVEACWGEPETATWTRHAVGPGEG